MRKAPRTETVALYCQAMEVDGDGERSNGVRWRMGLCFCSCYFPISFSSFGYAEKMTHHHSRPSPISLPLWDSLLVCRVCCARSGDGFLYLAF